MSKKENKFDTDKFVTDKQCDCPQEQAFISFGEDLTKDEIISACQTVMGFETLNDVDRFVFDMNIRFSKRNNMGGRVVVITVGDDTNYLAIPEGWTPDGDIYNVIVGLKGMLEHYVSGRADNWDGSTRTQALVTIKQANQILKKLKET